jgi:uncharacterized protein (TIGR03084 family)
MTNICNDLADEQASLDCLVAGTDDVGWNLPSAAEGWSIRDSISHLAQFEEEGLTAVTDPAAFAELNARAAELEAIDPTAYVATGVERGRRMAPIEVLEWWRESRSQLVEALRALDPKERLPWFAAPMSAISFATARLMETWAHGFDVADGLGRHLPATDRLRHVALIGCLTRSHSYGVNHLSQPQNPVRVELVLPTGTPWLWGPEEASDRIRGPVESFCLIVTRRRHIDAVDLEIHGAEARKWMEIAQAYAGPPGSGRGPGWRPPGAAESN